MSHGWPGVHLASQLRRHKVSNRLRQVYRAFSAIAASSACRNSCCSAASSFIAVAGHIKHVDRRLAFRIHQRHLDIASPRRQRQADRAQQSRNVLRHHLQQRAVRSTPRRRSPPASPPSPSAPRRRARRRPLSSFSTGALPVITSCTLCHKPHRARTRSSPACESCP